MNYKNNAKREFQEMLNQFPEMSLQEVLYTIARELKIENKSDFLKRTDEEVYTAINKAIKFEKKEPLLTEQEIENYFNKV